MDNNNGSPTIDTIKAAAAREGSHWFDASTMSFFKSRILPQVSVTPKGLAFVTSEQGPGRLRGYSVRVCTLDPWTIGNYEGTTFQGFSTAATARAFVNRQRVPGS